MKTTTKHKLLGVTVWKTEEEEENLAEMVQPPDKAKPWKLPTVDEFLSLGIGFCLFGIGAAALAAVVGIIVQQFRHL